MINPEAGNFTHPDFHQALAELPKKAENPYDNFSTIRGVINRYADANHTHPLVVASQLQVGRTDNAMEAKEIEKSRIARFGYVSDIHGLTEEDFSKLRTTLVAGNFNQVFF